MSSTRDAAPVWTGADPAAAPPVSVLLIEDDRNIARSVAFQLGRMGYAVNRCADGESGLTEALRVPYDVIVLDIMLPKLDGLMLCKRLRAVRPEQAIIIISARGSDLDKITGLDFGADDYLAKPFSPGELEARIRALRRRAQQNEAPPSPVLKVGDVTLDTLRRAVVVRGREARLTCKEFDLLAVLMRYPGRIFTRDALLAHVWGTGYTGFSRAVDAHVKRLRLKIAAMMPGEPELIDTVYAAGYRLNGPQS